jgi:hypothetical protein|tara:strand:- start:9279 stop:9440 length:162 start_codon:yes stop_codon:yes gene_type:complete
MARSNLKFTKVEDGVTVGYYFNCEESDYETFKADKESEGYTFDSNKTPEPISE